MGFIAVGEARDVPPGHMRAVNVGGYGLLVVNLNGKFHAFDSLCPHKRVDLSQGTLEGNVLTCPAHDARFDVTSGMCVAGAKLGPFKVGVKSLTSYETRIEGTQVFVKVG